MLTWAEIMSLEDIFGSYVTCPFIKCPFETPLDKDLRLVEGNWQEKHPEIDPQEEFQRENFGVYWRIPCHEPGMVRG